MSRHAYLIIAHKVDITLNTLLKLIDDSRNDVYLHMDKKNKTFSKDKLYSLQNANLFLTKRTNVTWGGYSMVRCELILFEHAFSNGPYEYYHLISGQDLPIKNQNYIHDFFTKNQGKEFLHYESDFYSDRHRIRYYHFFQEHIGRRKSGIIVKFSALVLRLQRILRVNRNSEVYFQKGAQWASLTNSFVRALLNEKSNIKKIFSNTVCCDELYKQTFALKFGYVKKLYHKEFDCNYISVSRLIDWKRGCPYVWTFKDKDELLNSEMCFARKFDPEIDSEIIQYFEKLLV